MEYKIIEIDGVKIKVRQRQKINRKKVTISINEKNYNYIKSINSKTNIEMSKLWDNLIELIKNDDEIRKKYLKKLEG